MYVQTILNVKHKITDVHEACGVFLNCVWIGFVTPHIVGKALEVLVLPLPDKTCLRQRIVLIGLISPRLTAL